MTDRAYETCFSNLVVRVKIFYYEKMMALKANAYKEGLINFKYASHLCLVIEKTYVL